MERAASRSEKAAVRNIAKKRKRSLDLGKMLNHPLYQRLEQAIISDEFKEALQRYGFTSAIEVASFKNYAALLQHYNGGAQEEADRNTLAEQVRDALIGIFSSDLVAKNPALLAFITDYVQEKSRQSKSSLPEPSYSFYEQAQREARKVYNLVRHTIAVKDPVNQSLRHTTSRSSVAVESILESGDASITYANPNSIQSEQSLAAYLKYIYDLAKDEINQANSVFELDTRRPDLQNLELSEDNLKKEITTIEIVNEVLLGQIMSKGSISQEEVFNQLKTRFYPLALPFDLEQAQVRTALAQMDKQTLNELARRTQLNGYVIDNRDFTLVPNPADALNLLGDNKPASDIWGNQIKLLSSGNTKAEDLYTTEHLYYYIHNYILKVSNFCRLTEISFDELCQLYRQYGVKDDLDTFYETDEQGATLFAQGKLKLQQIEDEDDFRFYRSDKKVWNSLYLVHFRSMHFLIQLYKRTGIPFHQLDWLLQVPGVSSDVVNNENFGYAAYRCIEDIGFDVIAHYLYYHQQFEISVDEFVALLWQINPYYRMDMEEISFLSQLFGDDAPTVRTKTLADNIKLPKVDNEYNKPLGDILRRGLKLSKTEWDVVVSYVDYDDRQTLNTTTLGCLYRLSKFFPLLGWDVINGLALAEKCNSQLLTDLVTHSYDGDRTKKILCAMDRLISLSQWMNTIELTPEYLTKVLTPSEEVEQQLQSTEKVKSWLQELQKTVETHRVKSSDFQSFTRRGDDGSITIDADTWFSELQNSEPQILDSYGIIPNVQRSDIETAVNSILENYGVAEEYRSIESLVDMLVECQDSQKDDLASQVTQLGDNVSTEVIAPMLLWLGTNPYTVLNTLLAWDYPDSDTPLGDLAQLKLLYDLKRYLFVIGFLSLGEIEVALVAEAPEMIGSSLLEQFFYLQKFKALQNNQVTADAWFTYLVLANSEAEPTNELKQQLNTILASLLECPQSDIETFLNGTVPTKVKELDYLARRIYLSQDLCLSASELNIVLDMNGDTPDAAAAAAGAILGGLYRYDGGSQEQAYRNSLAEQVRDALMAIFRSDVVAKDPTLSTFITDTEKLYEYLLLDVNVSSAVPTSRLVEACSSVQLYISRALAGMETGASVPNKTALKQEWQIAEQYRIWEANEKLELYPSNYIEPELRYKKSPIFQDFEAALGSENMNEETVQTAIYDYMEELQRVAELTVCGFSLDEVPGESMTFHFVARSNWEQEQYYYRSVIIYLEDERLDDPDAYWKAFEWEPWQKIQLSITNPVISQMAGIRRNPRE